MANDFYTSAKWKRKRENILRRDGYECTICKRYGRHKSAEIVHHIKSIEEAPELRLNSENLMSVCKDCHNKLHPEKGGRR